MGPEESEPVAYYWPIYYHFTWLLLPLLLVFSILRRPNRRVWTAWLLLLPTLVLPLLSLWVMALSDTLRLFSFLLDSATIYFFAMAFLWLTSDTLTGRTRPAAFGHAMLLLIPASVVGLVGVSGLGFGLMLIPAGFVYGLLVSAVLAVLLLSAVACRRRYSATRFLAWSALIAVPGVAGLVTVGAVLLTVPWLLLSGSGLGGGHLPGVLAGALTAGLATGMAVFVLELPFLGAALWSPEFRRRFHAIFRLPGMDYPGQEVYNDTVPELPAEQSCPNAEVDEDGED